ncbi:MULTISPECIES: TetR/AcrR family transcriptional regulator [unclassified Parafrankia]|uniref:TetR/AcrR family transcriptional regulator n=1 Tax=unclassified Parafrankia TaxID=2994368 RepID=UPI000DA502CD|nr:MULTISPECIES: TetR/AcrR family transcriptional regulator [unclassified Parafrankia]TCJ33402.1 TetR/AcrR family transcriptional regulator [Parafrankia sp. BMG5.11]CAI7974236.1 TetR/AcrR family transcriptional regulator [Frankia sp. Hr75.2]SQD96484.1 Transcriptional regulator, TetR family [Parafrankia sp. Ea1.12]
MAESPRADARRNYELILDVARDVFAEHGIDASLRDIARRAGVGIGTLYRHFPTREALLEALLGRGFDGLRARAESLLAAPRPRDALLTWLGEVATGSAVYQGLPASILAALEDESSALHGSCAAMRAAGAGLLERAARTGAVRGDITIDDLLAFVAAIAWASEQSSDPSGRAERLLSMMICGLAGARDPQMAPTSASDRDGHGHGQPSPEVTAP